MSIPEEFQIEAIRHKESGHYVWAKWDYRTKQQIGWEIVVSKEMVSFPDLDAVKAWCAENPKFRPEVPMGDIPF